MKTYPNPNRFELHDKAVGVITGLIDALYGWRYDQDAHKWESDGWQVTASDVRPQVDIWMPNGGHAGLRWVGPDEVVAVLRILGAPLDESRQLTAIDRAFEWIPAVAS
jgi:hypothetical protein